MKFSHAVSTEPVPARTRLLTLILIQIGTISKSTFHVQLIKNKNDDNLTCSMVSLCKLYWTWTVHLHSMQASRTMSMTLVEPEGPE